MTRKYGKTPHPTYIYIYIYIYICVCVCVCVCVCLRYKKYVTKYNLLRICLVRRGVWNHAGEKQQQNKTRKKEKKTDQSKGWGSILLNKRIAHFSWESLAITSFQIIQLEELLRHYTGSWRAFKIYSFSMSLNINAEVRHWCCTSVSHYRVER